MKPIYQTEKNCFASCIASILEVELKDVDVDITNCTKWIQVFNKMRETKEAVKPYDMFSMPYWLFKEYDKYRGTVLPGKCHCIVSSPSYYENEIPKEFHAVVGYINDKGQLSIIHNPTKEDCKKDQYLIDEKNVEILFLVKS